MDVSAQVAQKTVSGFGFSAQRIDSNLGSDEYTLVDVEIDTSSSTNGFSKDTEKMITTIVDTLKNSSRSGSMMVRVQTFASGLNEVHGFTELRNIAAGDYKLNIGGMTALFDAAGSGVEAVTAYGKDLDKFGYILNGIQVVITDGWENASRKILSFKQVKQKLDELKLSEALESMKTILIGIGDETSVRAGLETFAQEAGFDQFVWCGDATPSTLAKVAGFVSQSVSSQSQHLGTGGPSQNLAF